MPRNGSDVFQRAPNTVAVPGELIEAEDFNDFADDLVNDANQPRPVSVGGTGASNATSARANLGLTVGDEDIVNAVQRLSNSSIPNPFYVAWVGQSNALGSDGGSGTNWITETGRVEVWVSSLSAWVEAATRQGLEPFNGDGSNCPAVHAALEIARAQGVVVRLVMAVQGSTEIEQWTGGGYQNGVPITADRTISATNRVEFKKLTDAIAAAGIDEFHAMGTWHSEADLDTPESVYLEELAFLVADLKAQGNDPDPSRRFPVVVLPPYTGPKSKQQARRARTIEKFARKNSEFCEIAPTSDLEGRDDTPSDPNSVINHFTSEAYVTAGLRAGVALRGKWGGTSSPSDERLKDITIPAQGLEGERLGSRGWELTSLDGTQGAVTGATLASPVVVTEVAHGRETGSAVYIADVAGMTEINGRVFNITAIDADTYSLDGEDGTGHGGYTSGGTATSALDLQLGNGAMLGEVYALSGEVVVNMDSSANTSLGDGGRFFDHYTTSNTDHIRFFSTDGDGTTRQVEVMGGDGAVAGDVGLSLTGVNGRGRTVYAGSRYEILLEPRAAHSDSILEDGVNTSRRRVSPAELRTAGRAATRSVYGIEAIATDASLTTTENDSAILHSGVLTQDRQITLGTADAWAGRTVSVTRYGAGGFGLLVRESGEPVLATLAQDEWANFVFDGTAWQIIAKGSLT